MVSTNINAADRVTDLIFGRWRSQTLYAGAELGIFDHLAKNQPKNAEVLAAELYLGLRDVASGGEGALGFGIALAGGRGERPILERSFLAFCVN